jgi:hypothetical protein
MTGYNRSNWLARGLATSAVIWCVGLGIWLWIRPIRSQGVTTFMSATPDGTYRATFPVERTSSFAEISYFGAAPLFIPAMIAAVGMWGAWRRRSLPMAVATGIMLLFCFVTGFSIGSGYMPAAAALVWATLANVYAKSA